MELYTVIGKRLREIRGNRSQKKFVDELDLIKGMSRSQYSMVEIGQRPASLNLLDMVSEQENVSYDYLVGRINSRVDISQREYHELLEIWSLANNSQKEKILKYADKLVRKGETYVNR